MHLHSTVSLDFQTVNIKIIPGHIKLTCPIITVLTIGSIITEQQTSVLSNTYNNLSKDTAKGLEIRSASMTPTCEPKVKVKGHVKKTNFVLYLQAFDTARFTSLGNNSGIARSNSWFMSRTFTKPLLLFCLFCANTETRKHRR